MNLRDIRILYFRELRSALRDRTIVTAGIIVPILLYPLILWVAYTGFMFVSGQGENLKSRVMLKDLPAGHRMLENQFRSDPKIELKTASNPESAIREGSLDALVAFVPPENPSAIPANFRAKVTYDDSQDRSSTAEQRVEEKILDYRRFDLESRAVQLGISSEVFQGFRVESTNVSSKLEMAQFFLALMLPAFLLVILSTGAMYPAIDATAGERENSTWETVMTLATNRSNVLISKYLYVVTMSFTAGLLNLMAMMFSLRTILAPMFQLTGTGNVLSIPWSSIPIILLGAALMAMLVAAVMMILASFARTFKEGQAMVGPIYVVIMVPLMFLGTPGREFTAKLAVIPIMNVTMMFREAIQGIYHWPMIGITVVVEVMCIAAAMLAATSMMKFEDIVIGSYSGSFVRFAMDRLFRRALSR